jgi:hypothetical protein
MRHDAAVPDDVDYAWLGRLLDHPESWSADDLATARQLVATQKAALDDEHPRDVQGRQAKQELIDALEVAVAMYVERRAR